jgi:hypothetical protein
MGPHQPVPFPCDAHVSLGIGTAADQVGRLQHAHYRGELFGEPAPGDHRAVEELVLVLHEPEPPGLHRLAQLSVRPRINDVDLGVGLRGQRNAGAEDPLVVFQQQVAATPDAPGGHRREDLGHVGVDRGLAGGQGDRHPVVAVLDEVQVPDPVHVDGRDRLAAPLRQRQPLPSLPHAARCGPESAIEVFLRIRGADHGIQPDGLQAERPLALQAEGRDDLVEGENEVDVIRLAAQPAGEPREHLAAPHAKEVILDVGPRETGLTAHGGGPRGNASAAGAAGPVGRGGRRGRRSAAPRAPLPRPRTGRGPPRRVPQAREPHNDRTSAAAARAAGAVSGWPIP